MNCLCFLATFFKRGNPSILQPQEYTRKLNLQKFSQHSHVEDVPKIQIVILSEAKNLMFFFSSQKIKNEFLRTLSSG